MSNYLFTTSSSALTGIGGSYGWSAPSFPIHVDYESDMEQEVSITKGKDIFTMTRKELYRLIFMLEDQGTNINDCPLDVFINNLTAVRI